MISMRSPTGRQRHARLGRDMVDAEGRERRARAAVESAPVDQTEALRIVAAEKHVLGDAEARNDIKFLMDETQTKSMCFGGTANGHSLRSRAGSHRRRDRAHRRES